MENRYYATRWMDDALEAWPLRRTVLEGYAHVPAIRYAERERDIASSMTGSAKRDM